MSTIKKKVWMYHILMSFRKKNIFKNLQIKSFHLKPHTANSLQHLTSRKWFTAKTRFLWRHNRKSSMRNMWAMWRHNAVKWSSSEEWLNCNYLFRNSVTFFLCWDGLIEITSIEGILHSFFKNFLCCKYSSHQFFHSKLFKRCAE